jgi:lia operon protein LiaG
MHAHPRLQTNCTQRPSYLATGAWLTSSVRALNLTSSRFRMPRQFASTHPRASISHGTVLLAAACASLSIFTVTELGAQSERRTLSGREVSVYNLVGEVMVEPGSGSGVVVEVTRRGRDADRLRVVVEDVRGRNTLRVVYPDDDIVYTGSRRNSGNWNSEFSLNDDGTWGGNSRWNDRRRIRVKSRGDGVEAWADLRVLVPTGTTIDVNLGVGNLDARNVNADLRLDVASAKVTATGTRGRLSIDAGSGGIEVRDVNAETLELDTGSGSVLFSNVTGGMCNIDTGSGGVTGERITCDDFKVDAGSGSIRLDDVRSPTTSVESGSGGVRVNLLSAPRSLSVETGSGSVVVGLPSGVGAELDVQTGSGSITSDFDVQTNRFDRNHLRGRIGNGTGRIRIDTGSGSVQLRRTTGDSRDNRDR